MIKDIKCFLILFCQRNPWPSTILGTKKSIVITEFGGCIDGAAIENNNRPIFAAVLTFYVALQAQVMFNV